jgi:hypothetical protein
MKGHCISCAFFNHIEDTVGYCGVLGIMTEGGVGVIDTVDTLKIIKNSEDQTIYEPSIVQSFFGCTLYEDKNAKLRFQ